MYKLSNTSLNRIQGIHPVLIDILKEGIKGSPYDFGVPRLGGLRTDYDQLQLYAIGRTIQLERKPVTWTLNSNHKAKEDGYGYAFDIFVYVDGKATWDPKYYGPIADHLKKVAMDLFCGKLYWGGDWKKKDLPHFEIKELY